MRYNEMNDEFDLVADLAPPVEGPSEELLSNIKQRSFTMTTTGNEPKLTTAGSKRRRLGRGRTAVAALAATAVVGFGGVAAAQLLFDTETGTALAATVNCAGVNEPITGAVDVAEAIELCAEASGEDAAELEAKLVPSQNRVEIARIGEAVESDGAPLPDEEVVVVSDDIEFDTETAGTIDEIAYSSWEPRACLSFDEATQILEDRLAKSGFTEWTVSDESGLEDEPDPSDVEDLVPCASVFVEPTTKSLVLGTMYNPAEWYADSTN